MSQDAQMAERAALVQFGSELHRLRRSADMSQRELAKATLVSHQMLGAIERAERSPRKEFAEKADQVLRANGTLARLWPGAQDAYPHWFKKFIDLEAEARAIHDFQLQAVPGLFQTKDYARAVLGAGWPPKAEEENSRLLAVRLERQTLLQRKHPPLLWVVIDEGVLRRPVGSAEIMTEQLGRLLEIAAMPFIRLQVLPFAQGAHAAMDGAFKVLDMSNGETVAYAEVPGTGQVITDSDEVSQCALRFGALRSAALPPDESGEFIRQYKEKYENETQ
ncbi:helix-turn-helix domain-containing protein [Streptomonospora alba]|uniref:helix-turn-helix domain-containing protein n=1 Tax=Streptomonospora alba TaxID=183763 RepID=UPI001EE6E423|nr:helix-turn-helix transcriptional regulator [Streptomonospora alba]